MVKAASELETPAEDDVSLLVPTPRPFRTKLDLDIHSRSGSMIQICLELPDKMLSDGLLQIQHWLVVHGIEPVAITLFPIDRAVAIHVVFADETAADQFAAGFGGKKRIL